MEKEIEISLNKWKILLLIAVGVAFDVASILFIVKPQSFTSGICRSLEIIFITGLVGITFFGTITFSLALKLFDKKIGLKIDERGITDNTTVFGIGLIEWKDIMKIEKVHIYSSKQIMLYVKKPGKYIDRESNILLKQILRFNHKLYGTPISIISITIDISFNDLEKLLLDEFRQRKDKKMDKNCD